MKLSDIKPRVVRLGISMPVRHGSRKKLTPEEVLAQKNQYQAAYRKLHGRKR